MLTSSILSTTSFQLDKTFCGVMSAAVEQLKCKANLLGLFGQRSCSLNCALAFHPIITHFLFSSFKTLVKMGNINLPKPLMEMWTPATSLSPVKIGRNCSRPGFK